MGRARRPEQTAGLNKVQRLQSAAVGYCGIAGSAVLLRGAGLMMDV
jgi:hypothetical protein